MSGPTRREINRLVEELEEESLSAENRTLEDFPEILMRNLREHYDAVPENTSTSETSRGSH